MRFDELLRTVGNDSEVATDLATLDPVRKIVIHTDPEMRPDSRVAFLEVPPDFNIFLMFNMSDHPDDTEGWKLALKNGSSLHQALDGVFQVHNIM